MTHRAPAYTALSLIGMRVERKVRGPGLVGERLAAGHLEFAGPHRLVEFLPAVGLHDRRGFALKRCYAVASRTLTGTPTMELGSASHRSDISTARGIRRTERPERV